MKDTPSTIICCGQKFRCLYVPLFRDWQTLSHEECTMISTGEIGAWACMLHLIILNYNALWVYLLAVGMRSAVIYEAPKGREQETS